MNRKTRHYAAHVNYLRQLIRNEVIILYKVDGEYNPADIFTKPLPDTRFGDLLKVLRDVTTFSRRHVGERLLCENVQHKSA